MRYIPPGIETLRALKTALFVLPYLEELKIAV
jgi:hypothetical protein